MVDFTEALGEGRKVVLESTDTPRTTGYADMLQHGLSQTMGVHGVIASELGDDVSSVFASLPPTPIPSEVTDPSTVHPRAAVLRGPKVCPAAQAAKHEALEAAKAVITPYERPTPLTNFERRQLAQRYERAGRGAVPALRVQSDGAVAEDEPLAGIPTTREQAFVEDLVDPQFVHGECWRVVLPDPAAPPPTHTHRNITFHATELPSVLESSPYFTAGSPIESALATVARDAFHACRQDVSGSGGPPCHPPHVRHARDHAMHRGAGTTTRTASARRGGITCTWLRSLTSWRITCRCTRRVWVRGSSHNSREPRLPTSPPCAPRCRHQHHPGSILWADGGHVRGSGRCSAPQRPS